MQIGLQLPTFWSDYGNSSAAVAIAEAATAAEALGYDSIWANDVVIVRAGSDRNMFHVVEPMIALASVLHLAPRTQLGTHVIVLPQRNAFVVAKQMAALDILSEGRLILGIGIGWRRDEFELLDADFGERSARTDEVVAVLKTLWREPVASFHGRFHNFDDAYFAPKPPNGGPPIWVGGNTTAAVQRTARLGDGWMPYAPSLEVFQSGAALLRQLTAGRPTPTMAATINLRITRADEPAKVETKSAWQVLNIAGSAEQVTRYLEPFVQAGLQMPLCAFESEGVDDLLRQMRVFAEEVAPHLARGS